MTRLLAALVLALGLVALAPKVEAQTEPVGAFSFKRVSLGLTAEYVTYRPASAVAGLVGQGEFKVALPVAYNLGKLSSAQAKVRYGVSGKIVEYSGGITFHILARGGTP